MPGACAARRGAQGCRRPLPFRALTSRGLRTPRPPASGVSRPPSALRAVAADDKAVASETRAVNIAIGSNVLIFLAKFVVSQSSGSSSLASEAVHTLADIGNQLLLRLGIARSMMAPTSEYPYGYLKDKFVFSLISAVGVFCIGAGASLINGFHAIGDTDHDVANFGLNFLVLAVSFVVEGFSCVVAVRALQAGASKRGLSFLEYLDSGSDPAAVAVMAEDGAAVVGVTIAGIATGLVRLTDWQAWDGMGSILVGILLAAVALFLIQRNRRILIGRAMNPDDVAVITQHLERDPVVNHVYDVRTEEIGPDVYRFSAELDFNGNAIVEKHLNTVDASALQQKFMQTYNDALPTDTRAFNLVLREYGTQLVYAIGAEIDRIEAEVQKLVPGVRYVDLEADRGRFWQYRASMDEVAADARRTFDMSALSWDDVQWSREKDRIDFLLYQEKDGRDKGAATGSPGSKGQTAKTRDGTISPDSTEAGGSASDAERSLKYGQANEDVTAASHEVQLLKEQMDGMEYEHEQVDRTALSNKLNEQERKLAQLEGELLGLTKSIESMRLELKQDQYKNVDEEYWKRQVEMRSLEMGNKDLKKYAVGMEKALLAYHSNKMESINQTLKELWQKTYQGQDIDYIQIKAETAETGRSSYNYRVVMLCGAAELDMRGRCSAGQKVLACILIRMALAECFCVNCGVIALDEPTTNLDVANAAALAQALRSILDMRSSLARETARAFQLIVITHDENFATQLGTREYTEFLTRVTKDEDHHSILTEEPVS